MNKKIDRLVSIATDDKAPSADRTSALQSLSNWLMRARLDFIHKEQEKRDAVLRRKFR